MINHTEGNRSKRPKFIAKLAGLTSRVGRVILTCYLLIAVMFAVPYFNWEFAYQNGFWAWVDVGEIVPTMKAAVWPYFVWTRYRNWQEQQEMADWRNYLKQLHGASAWDMSQLTQADLAIIERVKQGGFEASRTDCARVMRKLIDISQQRLQKTERLQPPIGLREYHAIVLAQLRWERDSGDDLIEKLDHGANVTAVTAWLTEDQIRTEEDRLKLLPYLERCGYMREAAEVRADCIAYIKTVVKIIEAMHSPAQKAQGAAIQTLLKQRDGLNVVKPVIIHYLRAYIDRLAKQQEEFENLVPPPPLEETHRDLLHSLKVSRASLALIVKQYEGGQTPDLKAYDAQSSAIGRLWGDKLVTAMTPYHITDEEWKALLE